MGVTAPSYTDENGVTTNYAFSTDNASRIGDFLPSRANNSPVLAPNGTCANDCANTGHVRCDITALDECVDACLPGHAPFGQNCLPRVESDNANPLHDEVYKPVESWASPGETAVYTVELDPTAAVHHVELFLTTVDDSGEQDFS